jgi:hypothetical protein
MQVQTIHCCHHKEVDYGQRIKTGENKCRETYFAIFRWTKMSPGLEPVTDSGTLESEQPIQRD